MLVDDLLHGGLIEDEDGAPYPEHVQEVVRCLAAEVERLRTALRYCVRPTGYETDAAFALINSRRVAAQAVGAAEAIDPTDVQGAY